MLPGGSEDFSMQAADCRGPVMLWMDPARLAAATKAAGGLVVIVSGFTLAAAHPNFFDPSRWDTVSKVTGGLIGLGTIGGAMWKGIQHLQYRAMLQGQQKAQDDLPNLIALTQAVAAMEVAQREGAVQFASHITQDTHDFAAVREQQQRAYALLEKMDAKLDAVSEKARDTAKDVEWLIRERGGGKQHGQSPGPKA